MHKRNGDRVFDQTVQQTIINNEIDLAVLISSTGSVDEIKTAILLLKKNEIDKNIIMMVDEMYLCKCAQYSGGNFIECDTKRNLYKGVIVFMIQGIKKIIAA